tara:strand:- start:36 stop:227 length:192 start_codon:yes stop_codon:yes gene_type:complete
MAKIKLSQAILSLNPNAVFGYSHDQNDDSVELIDTISWQNNTTPISKEDILAEQQRLQAIEDA